MPPVRRPVRSIALLATAALLAVGCAADGDVEEDDAGLEQLDEDPGDDPSLESDEPADPEAAPADPSTADGLGVAIEDNRFAPEQLIAQVGDTVEWEHTGSNPHTVTFTDLDEDSGNLGAGDTFSVTFEQPGTYTYVCAIHGSMTAEIVIEG